MREKNKIIASLALAGFLAVIMIAGAVFNDRGMGYKAIENIENSRDPDNNREMEIETQEGLLQDDAMPFADDKAYQALKEIYGGIDFYGEFKKGNKEVYGYYKEKYARLLSGEVKITNELEEKCDWKSYGYSIQELTSPASAKLYYFDMDEDSLPELCIAGESGIHVFKYIPETNQYKIWREELKPGGNITGSGKIKSGSSCIFYEGSAYAFYSFSQLNKSGNLDYRVGFGIDNYELYPIYMVSWPLYKDEAKQMEMPKELKQQRYTKDVSDSDWNGYYFRVTKEQYEELTAEFFKADIMSQWERVPVSYFLPELEGIYGSFRDFPFDMPYADESVYEILENIYNGINFHGEFKKGNVKAYEAFKEKYALFLSGQASYTYDNGYGPEYGLGILTYGYDEELNDIPTKLYYFDMDGNGLPDICIENRYGTQVYKYNPDTNRFRLWWEADDIGYEIAGTRQIRYNGGSFYEFYQLKEDGKEDFNIMFGVMEAGNEEDLYIVSLPCYEDLTAASEILEEIIKQSYVSMEKGNYFFRVTKEQYEKLTKEYFETDMPPAWSRVPVSYFFI